MTRGRVSKILIALAISAVPAVVLGQFTTIHSITTPGDVKAVLGSTIVLNHGLVGAGRLSASALDSFGESLGSVSGLQITEWSRGADGSYGGTLNILPDRGYNAGSFFSDYAARINRVGFRFMPYESTIPLGGSTPLEKLLKQTQIQFTTPITGVRFTYDDPNAGPNVLTTGLDPAGGFTTLLFGSRPMPYVFQYLGPAAPGPDCTVSPLPPACKTYTVNRLPLDSEALVLKADGSGYIGDEYGGHVYYFNAAKKIIGAIVPPEAFEPRLLGAPNFSAVTTPTDGRRNNQGLEGVALSPDGTRLFAMLQSATIQDSDGNQQNRRQTRLLVYDVSVTPTPGSPIAEYALTLPTFRLNPAASPGAVNRTAAQSEILALDNTRLLVLSRDGNGLGNIDPNPSVYKSVLLVDTSLGTPTDISTSAAANIAGGRIILTSPLTPGTLDPAITPLTSTEAVNILNSTQLGKFNIELDQSGIGGLAYQVSKLTLSEKWEGLSLVPAQDPDRPNDFFLFLGNDNDFLTSAGQIRGPEGIVGYNGFSGYSPLRLPAPVDSPNKNENDTIVLAFRLTIISGAVSPNNDISPPSVTPVVAGTLGSNGWYTSTVNVTWTVADSDSGIALLSGCGPSNLTADTAGITLTCTATNGFGLSATVSTFVRIDKTAPAVTPPQNQTLPQLLATGALATYSAAAIVENGSGLDTSSCSPASGSVFPVGATTVTCTATDLAGNAGTATFKITVTPAPDGRMYGAGHLEQDSTRYHFIFRVSQVRTSDFGRLEFWTNESRRCSRNDDDRYRDRGFDGSLDRHYGQGHCQDINRFDATSIDSVVFSDDPSIRSGRGHAPTTDTVRFSGRGRWNGRPGYQFEVIATDGGEPGRRDSFSIVIKDASQRIVVRISDGLDGGNIQSTRLFGWNW